MSEKELKKAYNSACQSVAKVSFLTEEWERELYIAALYEAILWGKNVKWFIILYNSELYIIYKNHCK